MIRLVALVTAVLLLAACKPPEESRMKAIIGAVLIDPGSPPLSRSVLVVAGSRIRSIGDQSSTPVPAGSEKINGAGKFLIPAPVEIPSLEAAPRVSRMDELKARLKEGATVLTGMVTDTEEFDPALLQQMRDLRIVFVPRLHTLSGPALEVAGRNSKSLASQGVMIAASAGPDAGREWATLARAGLSPQEVLASATIHAARAAGVSGQAGALAPGLKANVWLLAANPLESVSNLSPPERILTEGEWKQ
jgi:imidazolonepropionase-like amidohydrolase